MAPEQRIGGLSDIPILPPSSTRSSRRSRSSSPSRPSDAQYRRGALRRANICVDEEIPMDIRRYTDSRVFHIPDKVNDLYKVSERLWGLSNQGTRPETIRGKPNGHEKLSERRGVLCLSYRFMKRSRVDRLDLFHQLFTVPPGGFCELN
ncbi:hypothetical protein BO86DRAFT_126341 [Aspergillus japonicus CBS 114.51]|uniref:Uncharacterized protein n=1 Tax=Aspergillus japonicus CBS 114.51 TaxID=1448312 RepID=A0A8T8WX45_ASPJA|nr:hypothetical protein BO86DRAFT_126341 [Aspergillus japonicus CBS 114.51]RAH80447.1 hypothetical protein BO86DRAFT_126341 [Aspergillus japonicus CBS 114.51]